MPPTTKYSFIFIPLFLFKMTHLTTKTIVANEPKDKEETTNKLSVTNACAKKAIAIFSLLKQSITNKALTNNTVLLPPSNHTPPASNKIKRITPPI